MPWDKLGTHKESSEFYLPPYVNFFLFTFDTLLGFGEVVTSCSVLAQTLPNSPHIDLE